MLFGSSQKNHGFKGILHVEKKKEVGRLGRDCSSAYKRQTKWRRETAMLRQLLCAQRRFQWKPPCDTCLLLLFIAPPVKFNNPTHKLPFWLSSPFVLPVLFFFLLFFISRFALLLLKHQQPLRSGEERGSPHLFPPTSPEILLYWPSAPSLDFPVTALLKPPCLPTPYAVTHSPQFSTGLY